VNIKVSHESPLYLLDASRFYNDYDYALVHLFDRYPEYFQFFRSSVLDNREVLLDNSIFELGKAFDPTQYIKYIDQLQPTYYIVPDVLEEYKETVESFKRFTDLYKSPYLKIGAIQGKTFHELVECYKFMCDNADYIAISFDYSLYEYIGTGTTKLHRMMTGRQNLIKMLIDNYIWDWTKPVHLLGCSLPQEFKFYCDKNIYNIRSVDTSNPVMAGIKHMKYAGNLGLQTKPVGLLAEHLEHVPDADALQLITYNINMFKQIVSK